MVDVPYLDHLCDGQKDCLDVGQVRCFHEEMTEVWILQGICPLKDEWVFGCSLKTRLADQTKTQQLKWLWSNDTKDSTINQRLVEQIQEETLSWKVVEVLPW